MKKQQDKTKSHQIKNKEGGQDPHMKKKTHIATKKKGPSRKKKKKTVMAFLYLIYQHLNQVMAELRLDFSKTFGKEGRKECVNIIYINILHSDYLYIYIYIYI